MAAITSDRVNNLMNQVSTWVFCPKEAKAVKEAAKQVDELNDKWEDADWDDVAGGLEFTGGIIGGILCAIAAAPTVVGVGVCVVGAGVAAGKGAIDQKKASKERDRIKKKIDEADDALAEEIQRLCRCLEKH